MYRGVWLGGGSRESDHKSLAAPFCKGSDADGWVCGRFWCGLDEMGPGSWWDVLSLAMKSPGKGSGDGCVSAHQKSPNINL